METLKKEKRDAAREWQKKLDEKDRMIAELSRRLGKSDPATSLPKIDTRVSTSSGSSPASSGAASYLRSFNPFAGRG